MKKNNRIIALIIVFCLAFNICIDTSMVRAFAESIEVPTTIIDVTEFGADPSGKTDSTIAIQKALEEAKKVEGHVTLSFPMGEYDFYKDFASQRQYHTSNTSSLGNPTKWIGMLIEDQTNLTIEGNGSLFNMHGDIMAIAIVRSENVVLQNFVLDYEVPDTMDVTFVGQGEEDGKPYTDIYVPANYNYEISENKQHITWLSENSPYTGKPYWSDEDTLGGYLVIYKGYDETVRRHQTKVVYEGKEYLDADPFVGLESIVEQGENILRFKYKDRRPNAQESGNVALLSNSARRRTAGAFISESKGTLVKDIDVHYLSGFGWLTQMSENTEFNGVDFLPREGTGKYTTSNADQIHVAGASGYFNVIDCNFSMAHDDPINVHGTYLRVEEVIDDKTLKLKYIHSQQGGFPAYFPGDEVMFYSRLNLEVPTGANENDTFTVKSAINPGEEYNGQTLSMRESVVTFDESFDEEVLNALKVKVKRGTNPNANVEEEPLYVAENVTYAPNVHIKGNVMRSIPTRGILCTTKNEVIIEENVFESLAMASIYLSNDADYWYESGPIRNMTIRNNKFNVRPTGQTEWGTVSPIFVDPVIVNQAVAAPGYTLPTVKGDPVHQNITIDGNEFNMAAFNLITAKGVKGM
ncbi:MAG: glycosyl hydrolase family 28-related protein, partial [Clostridium sp.]